MGDDTALAQVPPPAKPPNPVDQVYTWILAGASDHEIIECIERFWPDSKPKPLIVAAMKRIERSGDTADATTVRGWCIEATRHVYQKALETGDFPSALRAIKQIHALSG